MLRRSQRLLSEILIAADIITLAASFVFVYWLRTHFDLYGYNSMLRFEDYLMIMWIVIPAFIVSLGMCGLYRCSLHQPLTQTITAIVRASILGILLVLSVLYMTKEPLSRFVFNLFPIVAVIMLAGQRVVMRAIIDQFADYRRRRRAWQVLMVGEDEDTSTYLRLLEAHPHWGVVVAGTIRPSERVALALASNGNGRVKSGGLREVEWNEVLREYVVDEVVAVSPWSKAADMGVLEETCAQQGLVFRRLVTMPLPRVGRYNVDDVGGGSYLVSLETVPQASSSLFFKRAMDIALSSLGLALCSLVYLWYSRRLRRESPGPVFFAQKRIGRNGRVFNCYKFRTMHFGAERQQKEMLERSKLGGAFIKIKNDPRVTHTGAWMRRHHIDELPQFWNVLKGEMSLVGARPSQPVEVSNYRDPQRRRLSMKPGLTGLFQVSGHDAISDFDEVVRLDCHYIDNWSLWLDCKILTQTCLKVFAGDGW